MIRTDQIMPVLSKGMSARNFLFFDTETREKRIDATRKHLTFKLGYAIYVEFDHEYKPVCWAEHELWSAHDFISLLWRYATPKAALYCVAHNLAFDMQILDLPERLNREGYKLDLPVLSQTACLWTAHKEKSPIHFLDSRNLIPGTLAQIGVDLDLPKFSIDFATASDSNLMLYCARDVQILQMACTRYLRFVHDNQLGYFAETVPWQALVAYRTRFYSANIHIHTDYVALDYERRAYMGARTECFYIGQAPEAEYTLLDVNSMYAYVMAENEYPTELVRVEVNVSIDRLRQLVEEYYVIAECELSANAPTYPVRTLSKLVFPIGRFRTWLHQAELSQAYSRDELCKVGICLLYRRAYLFRDYVGFFSALRQDARRSADKTNERLAKLFLVSLYGKFGQRNYEKYDLGLADAEGVNYYPCKVLGTSLVFDEWDFFGRHYSTIKAGEKPYSCPSIAGAITAYGRMYLWELMQKAGMENVFYCDTDSLLVNELGVCNLAESINETALGSLKVVQQSDSLRIYNPKDFVLGPHAVRKGVQPDNPRIAKDTLKTDHFTGLQTAMKHAVHGYVEVRTKPHRRVQTYDKGRILDNGHVVPWELPRDENERVFHA